MKWSLPAALDSLHTEVVQKLAVSRAVFAHPTMRGDTTEKAWLEMLQKYLPQRYSISNAVIADSDDNFSDQIDIVVYDRQYTPFVFRIDEQIIIPAEAVYAVFECKQTADAAQITYTQDKIRSVRRLRRTSVSIPHAGGTYGAKSLHHIIGGLLTTESGWTPPLGVSLQAHLLNQRIEDQIDLGCIANHGLFCLDAEKAPVVIPHAKAATAFLFELIARLQSLGTVPMVDIRAYAKHL